MYHKGESKKMKTGHGENPRVGDSEELTRQVTDPHPMGERPSTKTTFASGYVVQLQEINFLCQRHILGLLASFHLENF